MGESTGNEIQRMKTDKDMKSQKWLHSSHDTQQMDTTTKLLYHNNFRNNKKKLNEDKNDKKKMKTQYNTMH